MDEGAGPNAPAGESSLDRRHEVAAYRMRLREYGMELHDLARVTPRHEGVRRAAIAVARLVAADPELLHHLMVHRELPLAELRARAPFSRRILAQQKAYITAVAVMLTNEFPGLAAYLS